MSFFGHWCDYSGGGIAPARSVIGERDDLAGLDTDVADHRIGGGDDYAAADDEIEFSHRRSPVAAASPTRRRLNFAAARDEHSPSRRHEASKLGRRARLCMVRHPR